MKMEREKTLERKLKTKIEGLGGWCIKLLSGHISGLPDRLCLLPRGKLFFAEVKGTGKKPTKIQSLIHSKIRSLGFQVEVIDSTEKIDELLSERPLVDPSKVIKTSPKMIREDFKTK